MSVLESMRSGTDSTFMQIIFAIVVVSFVFWYAKPAGDTAAVVANVNGTRIMSPDLDRAVRMSLATAPARTEEEQLLRRDLMRQQLVNQELLVQAARKSGLVLDYDRKNGYSRMVALQRMENGMFQGEDGEFDAEIYRSVVRSFGYTPDQYEADLERRALVDKVVRLMSFGVVIPDTLLRQAYVDLNTKVDLRYVRIRPIQFHDAVDTSEAAVTAWIAANAGAVEAAYTADFDRLYDLPAEVELQLIRLDITGDGQGVAELRPRLEALRAEVLAAADPAAAFAEAAARWSEDPSAEAGGSIGVQKVTDLAEGAREVADGLEVGALSEVIVGESDLVLYRLASRTAAREVPVDEVRTEIAARLMREEQAPGLAAAFAEELRGAWGAAGALPIELLDRHGLSSQTTGFVGRDEPAGLLSPPTDMIEAAMSTGTGAVLPQVYQSGEVLWVGAVDGRQEADLDLFEDEREQVREEVLRARRGEFLQGWVDSEIAKLEL